MKKILFFLLFFQSIISYSQDVLRISMKNSKDEVLCDTTLMNVLKYCNINIHDYTVLPIDRMVDTVSFIKGNKFKCKTIKQEVYFTNEDDLCIRYYEKACNEFSKKPLKEKFMFCYISKDKNEKNKYKALFYMIE